MAAAKPQTFLISGCASGIGKHMALALARAPLAHNLMLLDIDGGALERVVSEHGLAGSPRILARVHDVRDATGWERIATECAESFGSLDVMLNIAGYLKPGNIDKLPVAEIDRQIDVNVKGVIYATRAGAQVMLRQGSGHIINVASLAGIAHVPGISVYCASKHAVRGFSLAVAHELARHGIAVSVLCPDAVETPMLELQVGHADAALVFAGGRGLSVEEVEHAIMDIIAQRPLERVLVKPGTARGVLAKLANVFPPLASLGLDRVRQQGREAQAARKRVQPR